MLRFWVPVLEWYAGRWLCIICVFRDFNLRSRVGCHCLHSPSQMHWPNQGWKGYSWQVDTQDKIALQQAPPSDTGGSSIKVWLWMCLISAMSFHLNRGCKTVCWDAGFCVNTCPCISFVKIRKQKTSLKLTETSIGFSNLAMVQLSDRNSTNTTVMQHVFPRLTYPTSPSLSLRLGLCFHQHCFCAHMASHVISSHGSIYNYIYMSLIDLDWSRLAHLVNKNCFCKAQVEEFQEAFGLFDKVSFSLPL